VLEPVAVLPKILRVLNNSVPQVNSVLYEAAKYRVFFKKIHHMSFTSLTKIKSTIAAAICV